MSFQQCDTPEYYVDNFVYSYFPYTPPESVSEVHLPPGYKELFPADQQSSCT